MSFKKKDLEIVYNLRWKNGPKREDKNQIMSIVAVYDIPATTLNFEIFKSYLLKNSGTAEDDVSVIYIMDSGKEYAIKSQTDFQVALYDFRRKARVGEVINLLLERISDQPIHKNLRHSNDVETQSDNMEPNSMLTTCSNIDTPPEWFIAGLAQLKKDIKEEVTANVSSIVAGAIADLKSPNLNPPQQYALCPHHRIRSRYERRLRKITPHTTESVTDAKDLIKSLKLENKLEKLERKASKYREKRLALQNCHKSSDNGPKSSDSEAGPSTSRSRSRDKEEKRKREEHQKRKAEEHQKHRGEDLKMDASPVNVQTSIPHMLGGEVYLHQWEVQNTGQAQWTSKTQLQYTWGSKLLVPLEKTLSVPCLKPGEKGTVTVRLHIPTVSGTYECYWQFTHKGRRFGHWLGVQVIVDSFDLKGHSSVLEKTEPLSLDYNFKHLNEEYEKLGNSDLDTPKKSSDKAKSPEAQPSFVKALHFGKQTDKIANDLVKNGDELLREMCDDLGVLRLGKNASAELLAGNTELYEKLKSLANEDELDSDCSWSSEPTHFWSKIDEKGEYVVVPVPQCFVLDTPDSSDNNMDKKEAIFSNKGESPKKDNQPEPTQAATSKDQKGDVIDNFDDNNNTESVSGASGGSIKLRDEELDNIVVITVPKDEQVKEGFIYVHVDGQKVLIPKNILKNEVITAAQELEKSPSTSNSVGVIIDSNESLNKSPTPSIASTITGQSINQAGSKSSSLIDTKKDDDNLGNTLDSTPSKKLEGPVVQYNLPDNVAVDLSTSSREVPEGPIDDAIDRSNYFEANNYMSHCSAAGSCYSEVNSQAERQNRMFVFPQDVPGYEVVYPVLDVNNPANPNLTTETFVSQHQPPPCAANPAYNIPQQVPNPFVVEPVPNYQQTPVELRRAPVYPGTDPLMYGGPFPEPPNVYLGGAPCVDVQQPVFEEEIQQPRAGGNQEPPPPSAPQVHMFPETLVNGAVNVASSAINTARSVINMIKPQAPGRWVNGHWVSSSPETPREANLQALAEMGFWNRDLNATLLARFNDDLNRVVAELVQ